MGCPVLCSGEWFWAEALRVCELGSCFWSLLARLITQVGQLTCIYRCVDFRNHLIPSSSALIDKETVPMGRSVPDSVLGSYLFPHQNCISTFSELWNPRLNQQTCTEWKPKDTRNWAKNRVWRGFLWKWVPPGPKWIERSQGFIVL